MTKGLSPDPETAAWVIDQMQVTQRLSGLYQARFGEDNPLEPQMVEALDELALEDVARLAGGEQPDVAADELKATVEEWADEERVRSLGARAFTSFTERQNARIAEQLRGKLLVVTRLEETPSRAISTHPYDGMNPVEGPVEMVFRDVRSQSGRIGLGLRETSGPETGLSGPLPKLEPELYAYILGPDSRQQLDLQIKGPAGWHS